MSQGTLETDGCCGILYPGLPEHPCRHPMGHTGFCTWQRHLVRVGSDCSPKPAPHPYQYTNDIPYRGCGICGAGAGAYVHSPGARPNPRFSPGDAVLRDNLTPTPHAIGPLEFEERREEGRILHAEWHDLLGRWEYYVAFFGEKLPAFGEPSPQKPYVLYYPETSLVAL